MTISRDVLSAKLDESLALRPRRLTRRDVRLPAIPGKALAVIGVRRSGKTSFLVQRRADRLRSGAPPESQLLLLLEDERLAGMTVADLGWIVEEHRRRFPRLQDRGGVTLFLDEVQTVPGWEGLVRRLMDTGGLDVFVTGSSARLLSREVATSLRGRALDVLVHPFSFREALRHAGHEPPASGETPADLDLRLRRYLMEGGFPEAQNAHPRDRAALLSGYVDVVVLRDVIDRHGVTNPLALRWLQRQLLAHPGGGLSVKKHYDTLRAYLGYLEDAFLVRTVGLDAPSERRRMVNPRKAYPVDPGLIALFGPGGSHEGRALETAVLLELERRGWEVSYLRTPEGWEVDFVARRPAEAPLLVQVCLETAADDTWEREVRSLHAAGAIHGGARRVLVTLDSSPPRRPLPDGVTWAPAGRWLLDVPGGRASGGLHRTSG